MVTKRTRWLSAFSVVLMLISMLSCIFVASAQDVSGAEALLDKLNKYEAKNFTDEANAEISGFKDGVIGVIADFAEATDENYNHPEDGYAATLAAFEEEFEATLVPFIKTQLTADASPIYSAKDLYEGFTTPEGEPFTNYDIATKEDWYGVIKDSDNYYDYAFENDKEYTTFAGYTFNFVADIDFENVMMYPAGANPIDYFQGNINGNGHTLSNLNIDFSRFTNLKYYDEEGTEIKSGVAGSECAGGFISRSKGITVENIIFRNVVIHEKMNSNYKDYQGNSLAGDNGYNNAGLFGNPHSAPATYKNIIAEVTFDVPIHKCGSGFLGGAGNGYSFTLQNIYYDVTYKNIIAGNIEYINYGFSQHNTAMAMTNCVLVSDSEVPTERALYAVRYKGLSNEPALKNIFSAGAPALAFHDANDMGPEGIAAEYAEKKAYDCATAAEAIYKFNHAQGDLMENERCYFDMDAEGKVTFARGAGNVYAVTLTNGEEVSTLYYPAGATVTITLPVGASLKVDGNADEDAIFEMPAADVTAEIFYDASGMLAAAVQELTALRNKYAPLEAAYVTDLAPITAWLADADAALAGAPTIDDLNALIERGNALTVEVKADALIPYSKAAAYTPFATINTWAIAEKADWDAVIAANANFSGITLKVTNDVDFANAETAPAATFKGTLDGQGYVFKNLNIVGSGSSVGLFASFAGTVKNLGLTGKLTSAGTGSIGSFGGGTCSGTISKCWSSMTLDLTGATATQIGGLVGRGEGALAMDKCFFIGSVVGEPANGAGGLTGYIGSGVGKITNSFVAATGVEGIGRSHYNVYYNKALGTLVTPFKDQTTNSYAAGTSPFAFRHNDSANEYLTALNLLAETAEYQAFVAKYGLDADAYATGEIAYLINKGAAEEFTAIYTNDPVAGTVSFSDGTDATRKVSLVGAITKDIYVPAGKTFDLKTVNASAAYAVITLDAASTITDGVLTMANEDIEVNVTIDDDSLLAAAKAELQAAYDAKSVYDAKYLNEGEDLEAWMADAREALISTEIEIAAVQELTAAAAEMTLTLKNVAGAYAPYSKKDIYGPLAPNNKDWGISTKADWLAWVTESTTNAKSYSGYTFHVNNDIDFENTEMLPIGYGKNRLEGMIDGHGYVFSNINIKANGGTGKNGVGLVCDLTGAAAGIKNLGLASGTITSVTGARKSEIGSFAGFTKLATISNCWSAVTLSIPMGAGVYAGGLFGQLQQASSRVNACYFIGSFDAEPGATDTLGGIVGYGETVAGTVHNSFAATSGVSGLNNLHQNAFAAGVDFNAKVGTVNSYAIGFQAFDMRHTGEDAYFAVFENHADAIAAFEAQYKLDATAYSSGELAYKLNAGRAEGDTSFYFTVKNNATVLGTAANETIALTLKAGEEVVGVLYFNKDAGEVELAYEGVKSFDSVEGGAAIVDNKLTITGNATINVTLPSAVDEELGEALVALQAAYDAKKVYDAKYLVEGEALAAWLASADAALKAATPDKAAVLALVAEAEAMTLTLKNEYGFYVPYSMKSTYASLNTAKQWGISTKADWLAWVTESTTNASSYSGHTFHVQADIDFENTEMLPIGYGKNRLEGMIDGHGHVFSNINIKANGGSGINGVGLVCDVTGAAAGIKNLGLASGTITSVTGARKSVIGSFAGFTKLATISNCWSAVTLSIPMGAGVYAGGLFGQLQQASSRVNACYFIGSFDAEPGETDTVGGIVGYGETVAGTVRNCFAVTAGVSGLNNLHQNAFAAGVDFNAKVGTVNSYAIGFQAFDMRHTGEDAYFAVFENHADAIAAFEAQYKLDATAYSSGELAYKLNAGRAEGDTSFYFTVKNNATVLGTAANETIALTLKAGEEVVGVLYFNKDAGEVELAYEGVASFDSVEGGAAIVDNKLTITGNATINVTKYVPVVLGDAKEDGVINLVDAIAVLRGSVDLDTDVNVANGDVNANGILDANDAVLIVRFWLNDPAYDGPQLG